MGGLVRLFVDYDFNVPSFLALNREKLHQQLF